MAKKKQDPELTAIGQRIRTARKSRGLTMEKLAEAADTSVQFLSQVEKGEQSMTMVKFGKLAKALDVSSDFLLFGRDPLNERSALAAEFMGHLSMVDRDILSLAIINLRNILDQVSPENE